MNNLDRDEVHSMKLHKTTRRCTGSAARVLQEEAMSYMAVMVWVVSRHNLAKITHVYSVLVLMTHLLVTTILMIPTTRTSSCSSLQLLRPIAASRA